MRIGELRHRITLQKLNPSRDSFGAEDPEWVDVATVWAAIYPISGREYFAAQQVNAEISTKIIMRYRTGVESKMRVTCGERTFEILAVIHFQEKKKELQLMCREVV